MPTPAKVFIERYKDTGTYSYGTQVVVAYFDGSSVFNGGNSVVDVPFPSQPTSFADIAGWTITAVLADAVIQGYTVTVADIINAVPDHTGFSKITVRKADGSVVGDPLDMSGITQVSSGQAVVYLTDNGASGGAALFADVHSIQVTVNSITQTVSTDIASLSSDKKTLTINAKKLAIALAILNLTTNASNGTPLAWRVIGTKA